MILHCAVRVQARPLADKSEDDTGEVVTQRKATSPTRVLLRLRQTRTRCAGCPGRTDTRLLVTPRNPYPTEPPHELALTVYALQLG